MTPVRPPMIIPPPGVITLPVVTPTLAAVVTSVKTDSISSPSPKITTPTSTVADVKPLASMPATVAASTTQSAESAVSDAQKQKLEELEKKLAEEQEPQTLQQQENMMIKGTNARHILMQKLMRRTEVSLNLAVQISLIAVNFTIRFLCKLYLFVSSIYKCLLIVISAIKSSLTLLFP